MPARLPTLIAAALVAVMLLGGFLGLLWAREAKKKRLSLQGSHS